MPMPAEDPPPGVPDWVLSFGDMMSLLLCFFILLFAFSEPKQDEKMKAAMESILEQFGNEQALQAFLAKSKSADSGKASKKGKPMPEGARQKMMGTGAGIRGLKPRVESIADGRRTTVGGPVLFRAGTDSLTPDGEEAVLVIGEQLKGKRQMIEVRSFVSPGVADPVAAERMAFARALQVKRTLVSKGGIDQMLIRISIAAPAELQKLARSSSGEEIAERVEVTCLSSTAEDYGAD
jgi:chemotaxis protein MotB